MQIKIRFFASYRETTRQREMALEVVPGTTVGQVLDLVVAQFPALDQVARVSRCVVNQEYVPSSTQVNEGDEVSFLPPVSGGDPSSSAGDVYEVTSEPLSVASSFDEATDETVGGVVIFVGVGRRFSKGKRVLYLEYEAYKEMAERKLAEIGVALRQQWPIERVSIRHRVGRLEIGEVAIVIGIGAPHRDEAFTACRYAIDTIKKNVPVWKKEVWEDGEVWVGQEGG